MKTPWLLSTVAVAAGHLLIAGALASPAKADPVRLQVVSPPESPADRMARLRQHRSILESALQRPNRTGPAEPPEPQARALHRPEPMILTAPDPSRSADEGQEQVTCEDAEQIVADFGFSDIGTQECSGDLYRFSAMRDGTAYAVGISAATGEIAEVSRQ